MGTLRCVDGVERVLACRMLVGRSPLVQFRIEDPLSSAEHAVIFWQENRWRVRDLASRNGTFVNGIRVASDHSQVIEVGDGLGFGGAPAMWMLSNGDAPQPVAVLYGSSEFCVGGGGLLLLPNEVDPEAVVYMRNGAWTLERSGETQPAESGDRIALSSGSWVLLLPELSEEGLRATERAMFRVADARLEFTVSMNEERVDLRLCQGVITRDVPSKSCLYLLLTLARCRVGSAGTEWIHVEDLANRLRCTRERLNVDIHRVRRLIQLAEVADAVNVVERRNGHELRCGGAAVTVARR
jgi:hypothetical protein